MSDADVKLAQVEALAVELRKLEGPNWVAPELNRVKHEFAVYRRSAEDARDKGQATRAAQDDAACIAMLDAAIPQWQGRYDDIMRTVASRRSRLIQPTHLHTGEYIAVSIDPDLRAAKGALVMRLSNLIDVHNAPTEEAHQERLDAIGDAVKAFTNALSAERRASRIRQAATDADAAVAQVMRAEAA